MKYALSLLTILFANSLHALPTSVTPTHGNVTHQVNGNTMTVTSTSDIACAKFDFNNNTLIAKNEHLKIDQEKTATFIMETDSLARADVFGKLTSQGSVVMAFPGGVHFKDGSTVDVAKLVVIAGKVDHTVLDQNKIRMIKDSGVKGASIINDGEIKTPKNTGLVAFIAPNAINYGVIIARKNKVYLGDGTRQGTAVDFYGDGIIRFLTLKTCRESLEKARKTAKDLGGQKGILVFDTEQAINILKGVVNTKIQNGDSVFIDIEEDINIYCDKTPPVAPSSCGMNCGCGHVPASNEAQTPSKQSVPVSSSIPHKEAQSTLPTPKDIIIVQDTAPIIQKTGPCDCGCTHAPISSSSSSPLTSSHTEMIKSDQISLYTIHKEASQAQTMPSFNEEKIQTHDIAADDHSIEQETVYEIRGEGEKEEVFIIPHNKRKRRKLPTSPATAA